MANTLSYAIDGLVVEGEVVFNLGGLCWTAAFGPAQVLALGDEGALQPEGDAPQHWAIAGPSLRTTRAALRQSADLALGTAGAALLLELLE